MSNIKGMSKKSEMDAVLEQVKSVREFLDGFADLNSLFKTAAKGMAALLYIQRKCQQDELKEVADMCDDYMSLLDALEPFSKKGE